MDARWKCVACSLVVIAIWLMVPGCRVTDITLWRPTPATSDSCEVIRIRDISYHPGKDADAVRHRLDVYAPKKLQGAPVVVLVHGGAWMLGDNRCCGLYSSVGEFLASQGIVAVLPNYRLSPAVKHPEHARDVARAIAWTKAHAAEYGGDPAQMFLLGHSAGGHLVALLATDERFLQAEGMRVGELRGVIGISGVYRIPPGKADVEIGGSKALGVRLDEMAPLRGVSTARDVSAPEKAGLPVSINVFGPAFGDDANTRAEASPITHVRRGLPPFLLLNADNELPLLSPMARALHEELLKCGNRSTMRTLEQRNHNSIVFKAIEPSDPAARAIVEFVREHAKVKADR